MTERHDNLELPPELTSSPCLQGERVAFTGRLASMTHRQAQRLVEEHGGFWAEHVSRRTTMLVIGEEGWPLEEDGRPSQKLRYADELWRQGHEIRIVKESEWLHLLGLDERRSEVHRLYTPAMLSQLLNVPVGVIRRWERSGLIQPVRKLYRLPYFDFQEVTCARRITELIESGVSCETIQEGLERLKSSVPGLERPLAQLDVLAQGSRLLYRDGFGLLEPASGQRCFDFDRPAADEQDGTHEEAPAIRFEDERSQGVSKSLGSDDAPTDERPIDWFVQGCRHLDAGDLESAVETFRMALMDNPLDAEANFHLAETLYRLGRPDGALERYYATVECDREYIEAWTQLGCLLVERGETSSALDAFDIALNTHPDCPEAHLHKAELLYRTGETEQAVPHWQAYLKFDDRGPWAEQARQRLEQAGAPASRPD